MASCTVTIFFTNLAPYFEYLLSRLGVPLKIELTYTHSQTQCNYLSHANDLFLLRIETVTWNAAAAHSSTSPNEPSYHYYINICTVAVFRHANVNVLIIIYCVVGGFASFIAFLRNNFVDGGVVGNNYVVPECEICGQCEAINFQHFQWGTYAYSGWCHAGE